MKQKVLQKTYILRANGIAPWGDYVFESGNVVTVPAGQQTQANLRVFAPQALANGEYPFRVQIESGKDAQDVLLVANVIPTSNVPGNSQGSLISGSLLSVLVVLALLAGLAVLLGLHKKK
jgi:hypothetical protein